MSGKFEPKTPVQLNPPKSDPISPEFLKQCNGVDGNLCYVAIKGQVFDVTGNKAYQPGGSYNGTYPPLYFSHMPPIFSLGNISRTDAYTQPVFAGHDASRALALTSTKAEDVRPDWSDLGDKEIGVLNDWYTFFSKRYNIVGVVEGAANL
ncbi:hypothetical protein BDZ45DRAFT_744481 [Acephala macrosclerotiorum]|nr:hypothetical protein BDZ45DRAFT_744481 [Acephala macrosclerotiorum]